MRIEVVQGDISTQRVDAIVNAANRAMRGGGGVDGAIHAAAGPGLLAECIERFPDGLATGAAGYTGGHDLAASWVIHVVGPNWNAGEQDRSLLTGCYAEALQVADTLEVAELAVPLVSAGVYGWPKQDAIDAAVSTLRETPSNVRSVRIVAFDTATADQVARTLDGR